MKKIFIGIAAITMATSFFSCEQDAPEINFSQTTTQISDFSAIIKAITDMTTSIEEKLALINQAITNQTLSFEQKMNLLQTAVEQGIITQKEEMEKLVAAIEAQTTSIEGKLELINQAIASQTLSFEQKMDLLQAAVEKGILTQKEEMEKLVAAIEAQTTSFEGRLDLLNQAIGSQTLSFEQKMDLLKAAVEKGLADNTAAITLMNTTFAQKMTEMMNTMTTNTATIEAAIKALNSNSGIYRLPGDKQAVYFRPEVWSVVKDDADLYKAVQGTLITTEPVVTTSQVSLHSCVIAITKKSSDTPRLLPSWDNTTIQVGGVNQEVVKVISMFTSAVYTIDKGSCALGCYEINITDVRGNLIQQYNFNGGAGGDVTLNFYNSTTGSLVTSGHVQVIMR